MAHLLCDRFMHTVRCPLLPLPTGTCTLRARTLHSSCSGYMLAWRVACRSCSAVRSAQLSRRSMAVSAVEAKAATRKHIKSVLKGLSPQHMQQQSTAIADKVLQSTFFQRCGSLGLYITCERLREVDTQSLLAAALHAGKRCHVPLVEDRDSNMRLVAIDGLQDLRPVPPFGILEPELTTSDGTPRPDALSVQAPLDVLLMPGLGFSLSGARLGRGGGYYDKMVEQLTQHAQQLGGHRPLLVGLSFEEQLLEDIPTSDHDHPVDVLVTPSRICVCTDALQQRGWA